MGIQEKIEAIRQKPEHIRMRYVWGMVAMSMLLIFVLWVFSVKESVKLINKGSSESLSEMAKQVKQKGEEGAQIMGEVKAAKDELERTVEEASNSASQEPVRE